MHPIVVLSRAVAAIALTLVISSVPAHANKFTYANQGDALSMDPYMFNESLLLNFTGNIYEPLVEQKDVFHHVTIDFGSLVALEVVPPQPAQPNVKCVLHAAQLFLTNEARQYDDTVCLQFRDTTIYSCLLRQCGCVNCAYKFPWGAKHLCRSPRAILTSA